MLRGRGVKNKDVVLVRFQAFGALNNFVDDLDEPTRWLVHVHGHPKPFKESRRRGHVRERNGVLMHLGLIERPSELKQRKNSTLEQVFIVFFVPLVAPAVDCTS